MLVVYKLYVTPESRACLSEPPSSETLNRLPGLASWGDIFQVCNNVEFDLISPFADDCVVWGVLLLVIIP